VSLSTAAVLNRLETIANASILLLPNRYQLIGTPQEPGHIHARAAVAAGNSVPGQSPENIALSQLTTDYVSVIARSLMVHPAR